MLLGLFSVLITNTLLGLALISFLGILPVSLITWTEVLKLIIKFKIFFLANMGQHQNLMSLIALINLNLS